MIETRNTRHFPTYIHSIHVRTVSIIIRIYCDYVVVLFQTSKIQDSRILKTGGVQRSMPTLQNAYYLRSGPEPRSSSSTQPPAPEPALEPALDLAPEQIPEPEHIAPLIRNYMAFANISVPHFYGDSGERGDEWLSWFKNYCEVSNQEDNTKRAKMLPF